MHEDQQANGSTAEEWNAMLEAKKVYMNSVVPKVHSALKSNRRPVRSASSLGVASESTNYTTTTTTTPRRRISLSKSLDFNNRTRPKSSRAAKVDAIVRQYMTDEGDTTSVIMSDKSTSVTIPVPDKSKATPSDSGKFKKAIIV